MWSVNALVQYKLNEHTVYLLLTKYYLKIFGTKYLKQSIYLKKEKKKSQQFKYILSGGHSNMVQAQEQIDTSS